METIANRKAPATNEGHFQNHSKRSKHTTVQRLSVTDELDLAEHVEIEQPTRAKSLHDREQDAKHRLRDAIVANGLTYSAGVGLFAMAEGYVQARIARLMAERDETQELTS
jgi:hypothetical protein